MALLNTNIGPERVQVFPVPLGNLQIPGAGISVASFLISTAFVFLIMVVLAVLLIS